MSRNLIAMSMVAAALAVAPAQADQPVNLVTVLTTGEPQSQLMSMVLNMQAMRRGAMVHVLLCGPAGDLALKKPPEQATAPQQPMGMSPQGLMQKIIADGATVEVCALYLPGKGLGQEALLDGIVAARPPEMAARLLAPNTRIMSH